VAGDELVVVAEGDSPLSSLLDQMTQPAAPAKPAVHATTRALPAGWRPRARPRTGRVLAGVAVSLGLVGLLLWIPWPHAAPPAAPKMAPSAADRARTPRPAPAQTSRPSASREPGRLRIDFDHPLRRGTLRVYVDDVLELEERLTGQQRSKALVFKMHEGTFRDELEVQPGLHEVRLEVRWDDNVKTERIVGNFPAGDPRRLEATLGRIRRDLSLEWK
jgi:hypothetical protein